MARDFLFEGLAEATKARHLPHFAISEKTGFLLFHKPHSFAKFACYFATNGEELSREQRLWLAVALSALCDIVAGRVRVRLKTPSVGIEKLPKFKLLKQAYDFFFEKGEGFDLICDMAKFDDVAERLRLFALIAFMGAVKISRWQ